LRQESFDGTVVSSSSGTTKSLLLPVRDAAAFLAHEAHAPVLGDYYRYRSGQRAGQSVGRAVASTHVPSLPRGDLLAFEVQRPPRSRRPGACREGHR
jgi:hypothetical protein